MLLLKWGKTDFLYTEFIDYYSDLQLNRFKLAHLHKANALDILSNILRNRKRCESYSLNARCGIIIT